MYEQNNKRSSFSNRHCKIEVQKFSADKRNTLDKNNLFIYLFHLWLKVHSKKREMVFMNTLAAFYQLFRLDYYHFISRRFYHLPT